MTDHSVQFPILRGKCSTFGGPHDDGVSPTEGLALVCDAEEFSEVAHLFLPGTKCPPGGKGLARKLNPHAYYCAMRWDYKKQPRSFLRSTLVRVTNTKNGYSVACSPIDWGPNVRTGRLIDLSPGAAEALGVETDDEVEVMLPARWRG